MPYGYGNTVVGGFGPFLNASFQSIANPWQNQNPLSAFSGTQGGWDPYGAFKSPLPTLPGGGTVGGGYIWQNGQWIPQDKNVGGFTWQDDKWAKDTPATKTLEDILNKIKSDAPSMRTDDAIIDPTFQVVPPTPPAKGSAEEAKALLDYENKLGIFNLYKSDSPVSQEEYAKSWSPGLGGPPTTMEQDYQSYLSGFGAQRRFYNLLSGVAGGTEDPSVLNQFRPNIASLYTTDSSGNRVQISGDLWGTKDDYTSWMNSPLNLSGWKYKTDNAENKGGSGTDWVSMLSDAFSM